MRELTFHTAFLRGAAIDPGKVAVIDGDHQATHAEHRDRVLRLCAVLRDLDIGPEDRFAVLSGNNHATSSSGMPRASARASSTRSTPGSARSS